MGARRRAPASRRWATHGPLIAAWMEESLVHGEGDWFGEPFTLTDQQRGFLDRLYRYDVATGRRLVRRCLLGRAKGWGKTELLAGIGLAELAGPLAPRSPNIPIGAASFEQADLLFGTARVMVTEGPLARYLEAYDTEILLRDQPGRMFRVAAAAGTNDGGRPTTFIADELHEWTGPKERVHLVISNSIAKRADGLVLNISTAGVDPGLLKGSPETLLGRMYAYGQAVLAGEIDDPAFLFDWLEGGDGWDYDDPDQLRAAVIEANEHAELFGVVDDICRRFHEIAFHEFARYHLNRWVNTPIDSWLPEGAWDACLVEGVELDPDLPSAVAVDMAHKSDSAAVVHAQPQPDGRVAVACQIWTPAEDQVIDVAAVDNHLRRIHRDHGSNLLEVGYDPAYFERSAQALADEGLPMVEFPQSAQRMVPACQHAYQLVLQRLVAHDGDPGLADHVGAARPRDAEGGWRLSKQKSGRPIDAAVALVMALWLATAPEGPDEDPINDVW